MDSAVRTENPSCFEMAESWVKTPHSKQLSGRASRDTVPERLLRSALHALGLRFRLHRRIGARLTVDVVLPKYRLACFIDGCYWHRHLCPHGGARLPGGPNRSAWERKFERVKERERMAEALLAASGYRTLRLWECEVIKDPAAQARRVEAFVAARD